MAPHPYESEFPSLDLDRPEDGILRLTLRGQGRLNAVSEAQHGELARVWQAIAQDDATRAVLVRGADGAFSSGGDLDLVLAIADDGGGLGEARAGTGLSIVQALVRDELQGTLELSSASGTRAEVVFPAA